MTFYFTLLKCSFVTISHIYLLTRRQTLPPFPLSLPGPSFHRHRCRCQNRIQRGTDTGDDNVPPSRYIGPFSQSNAGTGPTHSSVCHPAVRPSFISLASIHHLHATPICQCPTVTRRDIPAHARPFNPPICQFPSLNHILSLHHDLSHADQM